MRYTYKGFRFGGVLSYFCKKKTVTLWEKLI